MIDLLMTVDLSTVLPLLSPCFFRLFNRMPPFSAYCYTRNIKAPRNSFR